LADLDTAVGRGRVSLLADLDTAVGRGRVSLLTDLVTWHSKPLRHTEHPLIYSPTTDGDMHRAPSHIFSNQQAEMRERGKPGDPGLFKMSTMNERERQINKNLLENAETTLRQRQSMGGA
jgi:hypothetical protein